MRRKTAKKGKIQFKKNHTNSDQMGKKICPVLKASTFEKNLNRIYFAKISTLIPHIEYIVDAGS